MGILDGATTLTSKITTAIENSGPVQELSGAVDSIGSNLSNITNRVESALGGLSVSSIEKSITQGISSFFSGLTKSLPSLSKIVKLPIPNILSAYASVDYQLTLVLLSKDQYNNPLSYMKHGEQPAVIARTAGATPPYNQIKTVYGNFEFFIDDLEMDTTNAGDGDNFAAANFSFKVIEPYSMGNFFIALQAATVESKSGYANWRDANYALKIEFRGNDELGNMHNIPGTVKWIPISINDIGWTTDSSGSIYTINANASSDFALKKPVLEVTKDITISGKTVQEVLQSGPESLEATLNKIEKEIQQKNKWKVPELQYVIRFPDITSLPTETSNSQSTQNNAATTSGYQQSIISISSNLGLNQVNGNLVQTAIQANIIGKSPMGNNTQKSGDPIMGKNSVTYDKTKNINVRSKVKDNVVEGSYKFSQGARITDIINEVIIQSTYAAAAMSADAIDELGQRSWWAIDKQVYVLTGEDNSDNTGKSPRLIVFNIIPRKVHVAQTVAPGTQPPGIKNLAEKVVKRYDFIYSGKNTEIIKFDINFANQSWDIFTPTGNNNTQDANRSGDASQSTPPVDTQNLDRKKGSKSAPINSNNQQSDAHGGKEVINKKDGGGGLETADTKIARQFHNTINSSLTAMATADFTIIGDPFFITSSGMSNYQARMSSDIINLNLDGDCDAFHNELYVSVNFRNPIDINQTTGLYDFGPKVQDIPLTSWSGIYTVFRVHSRFSGGSFTQTLSTQRLVNQEMIIPGPVLSSQQSSTPAKVPQGAPTPNTADGDLGP